MSQRGDTLNTHPVHGTLSTFLGRVAEIAASHDSPETREDFQRFLTVGNHFHQRLTALDPVFTPLNMLDALQSDLANASSELETFHSAPEVQHLTNVNTHLDGALTRLSIHGNLHPSENGTPLIEILSASRKTAEEYMNAVEKKAAALDEHLRNAEKRSQEAQSNLEQRFQDTQRTLEELQSTIEGQKGRLDAAIAEYQNQFSASEERRRESFDSRLNTLDTQAKEQLEQRHTDIANHLNDAQTRTEAILGKNEQLQQEIEEHLLKAIGTSLFGAFDQRKRQIGRSKWIWGGVAALALLLQAGAVMWIAEHVKGTESAAIYSQPGFLLKASISIPLVVLILFCIRQYNHEREYEELYAFKGAISFSLAPYLDLVNDMSATEADEKYATFAVDTIQQIFDNPIPKKEPRLRLTRKDHTIIQGLLEHIGKLVEKVSLVK